MFLLMREFENRALLIRELRRGLFSLTQSHYTDQDILNFCNIPESTINADLKQEHVPFGAMKLHYFILGLRSLRAVARGRIPGSSTFVMGKKSSERVWWEWDGLADGNGGRNLDGGGSGNCRRSGTAVRGAQACKH
jgi:hypothetical protein